MRLQGTFALYSNTWKHRSEVGGGASLAMHAGDTMLVDGPNPRSDEAFQKLLLRFSAAAAQGTDVPSLIRLFCRETREFLQVSGVYYWQSLSPDEMVGA